MDKMVLEIKRNYIYDADRKGAKYSIDGGNKWLNGGEFNEAIFNDCLGFECAKDANTPFDVGSDIEELHMSVKSSKATLCNEILGKDMETALDCYFNRCASDKWAWVIKIDNTLQVYVMNADEFRAFTMEWAAINKRGRIRYKATSGKMIAWFENQI